MSRLNGDLLTGCAVFFFGLAAFCISFGIGNAAWGGESSRLFPQMVSLALCFFGVSLAVKGARSASFSLKSDPDVLRVCGLTLLGGFYILAIGKIGYIISTGIAIPAVLFMFGVKSPAGLVLSAVLCPLVYHLIFFKALNVYPPYAPWLEWALLLGKT